MAITTRETETLTTIYYNDGCTKKIKIHEIHTGDTIIPVFRYKIVRFILPNGTIDNDRSYDCKLIIDKNEEFDTDYTNIDIQMFATIHYKHGGIAKTKMHKNHKDKIFSEEFRYHDRSSYGLIRERGESNPEQVNYFKTIL